MSIALIHNLFMLGLIQVSNSKRIVVLNHFWTNDSQVPTVYAIQGLNIFKSHKFHLLRWIAANLLGCENLWHFICLLLAFSCYLSAKKIGPNLTEISHQLWKAFDGTKISNSLKIHVIMDHLVHRFPLSNRKSPLLEIRHMP